MRPRTCWPVRLAILALFAASQLSGCATTGNTLNPIVPTRFETRIGPYIVYTHNPLAHRCTPDGAPTSNRSSAQIETAARLAR